MGEGEPVSLEAALDQVAFLLSESTIGLMDAVGEIYTESDDVAGRFRGHLARIAGIAVGIRGSARMGRASMDTHGLYLDATRLYGEVTDFGRGQVRADMEFTQKRLLQLSSGPAAEKALVYQVARCLVRWTAEGRPVDAGLEDTEAHFERLLDFQRAGARAWKSPQCDVLEEAYRRAWQENLGTDGRS